MAAQQSFEKFNNLSALEKQRVLSQLDPKHFDPTTMAVAAAAANLQMQGLMQSGQQNASAASVANAMAAGLPTVNPNQGVPLPTHHNVHHQLPPPPQSPTMIHSSSGSGGSNSSRHDVVIPTSSSSSSSTSSSSTAHMVEQMVQKSVETLR